MSSESDPSPNFSVGGTVRDAVRAFGAALDDLGEALCLFDPDDRCIHWNRSFLQLFPEHAGHVFEGEPYRENLRRFYSVRLSEEELPQINAFIDAGVARHRAQSRPYTFEHRGRQILVTAFELEDGSRVRIWRASQMLPVEERAAPLNLADGSSPMEVRQVLDHVPDGLMICAPDGCIQWVNKPFQNIYGLYDRVLALGTTFESVFRIAWMNSGESAGNASFQAGLKVLAENLRFNGAPFELPLPGQKYVRIITNPTSARETIYAHVDISELKRQQRLLQDAERAARRDSERAYHMATHDVLTSLPNRMLANEQLKTHFTTMKRTRIVYSILMLDIDHFKLINDMHGHAMGDAVLRMIAGELRKAVRESDFVARVGGEEFLVLLPATEIDDACHVAEKVRRVVESIQSPSGDRVTVSLGVAVASPDDDNEDVCAVKADQMLYKAKRAGRNRVMWAIS